MHTAEDLGSLTWGTLLSFGIGSPSKQGIQLGNALFSWAIEDEMRAGVIDGNKVLVIDFHPRNYSYNRGTLVNCDTGELSEVDYRNIGPMAAYMLSIISES